MTSSRRTSAKAIKSGTAAAGKRPLRHRVDRYALDVQAGRIVAGPLVRLACERHLADRARRDLIFSAERADHAIDFIEKHLRLADTLDDEGRPKPFLLSSWQVFIVGSLFGWLLPSGVRRFRQAFIEIGKGAGKTPLCAAIGLYGLMMDGEPAAEIYAAAVDRQQAAIMFRDAERMVEASPSLAKRVRSLAGNLSYPPTDSFFRPFSREQGAKSGQRPHMGLLDEVHEHRSPTVVSKMVAGAKGRKNALFVEITNSGFDRTSICWQHHQHSERVVRGTIHDDRWFAYVCALDEGDDPLESEACWIKANPNLGVTIQLQYLRDQVANARNIPAQLNDVLRLNFCVWTQQHSRYLDMTRWHACPSAFDLDDLIGLPCYGGLDLGESDDLTCFVKLWVLESGAWVVQLRAWIPQAALEKRPNRPYDEWVRSGVLEITEGDITDFNVVQDAVEAECLEHGVLECAYDKRFAQQMALNLQGAGIRMVDTPQGFQLNEPIKKLAEQVVGGRLNHLENPLLAWAASNVVVRHGRNREVRLDKDKATEKIDPIAALVMAASRAIVHVSHDSAYAQGHGLMTVGG